jgi:CRISPR-associated protein Cmr1
MKGLELHLDFVTPLWTADATGKARHVEGTGLIGSLRWWYEALIRGLGGWACDPSDSKERCPQDVTVTAENVDDALCPACQLFGATGWAKPFSMAVDDDTSGGYPPTGRRREATTGDRKDREGEHSAWFFSPGRSGRVRLAFLPRRPEDQLVPFRMLGLLEFIRRNAALGAKTNLGYGLFRWLREPRPLDLVTKEFAGMMTEQARSGRRAEPRRRPDLRQMFFARVALDKPWGSQDFVNFKYDLRAAFRDEAIIRDLVPDGGARTILRHFLLGTVKGRDAPQASKVKMALVPPDQRNLRVWGWVPSRLIGDVQREAIVDLLCQEIACPEGRHVVRWREFDSSRDTVGRFTDSTEYLSSFMEEQR